MSRVWLIILAFGLTVLGAAWWFRLPKSPQHVPEVIQRGRDFTHARHLTDWWDDPPAVVQANSIPSGSPSNIHPSDYVGPDACKDCHPQNYTSWTKHPHRAMNALANEATVKGDFTPDAAMFYRGGRTTFVHKGDQYLMVLERDGIRRTYAIAQTVGSRFYQRYVGKQIEGPEPASHSFYSTNHVLPFSYWLEQKEWIPVVHVGPEVTDDERPDPFHPPDRGVYYAEYSGSCNYCHTTFPLADQLGRHPFLMGEHAPVQLHWSLQKYLAEAHPDLLPTVAKAVEDPQSVRKNPMGAWDASKYAVTLGVSCEACHLGCRTHVASGGHTRPQFFPSSPYLMVEGTASWDHGRTQANVNWACGRCHTGNRPRYAAGMATWNSIEYSDAMRGSCYSRLRCVDCHNPHEATGRRWSRSAEQDDALCLKCHDSLQPPAKRQAHTHHPMGSEGTRCMNCHMPRINEGLQEVVRTHMIYSPTRADMIEANHPNACSLCHMKEPIDWTLRYLREWYGASFKEAKIAANYPQREQGVGEGWLSSPNPAVRLVAVETFTKARDRSMLPKLLDALDDPYLVNRQFAYKGLQELLGVRLRDLGYRYYMTSTERRQPIERLRLRFTP